MLFLFLEVGGRPVAIYLLVNVLNIYADNADDVDNFDDVDNVGDVGDVGDADLAKTLLPTPSDSHPLSGVSASWRNISFARDFRPKSWWPSL
jgi:hypothetical protein